MSHAFGIYKVVSVKKSENKEFPYTLKCVDPSTNEKTSIKSKRQYPIGTAILGIQLQD